MRTPSDAEAYHYRVDFSYYPKRQVVVYRAKVLGVGDKVIEVERNEASGYRTRIPVGEWFKTAEDAVADWQFRSSERAADLKQEAFDIEATLQMTPVNAWESEVSED